MFHSYNWLIGTFPRQVELPQYTISNDELNLLQPDKELFDNITDTRWEIEKEYKAFQAMMKKYPELAESLTDFKYSINYYDYLWAKFIVQSRSISDPNTGRLLIPPYITQRTFTASKVISNNFSEILLGTATVRDTERPESIQNLSKC